MSVVTLLLAWQLLPSTDPQWDATHSRSPVASSLNSAPLSSKASARTSLTLTGGQRWTNWGTDSYALVALNVALPEVAPGSEPSIASTALQQEPKLNDRLRWLTVPRAGLILAAAYRANAATLSTTRLKALASRARLAAAVPELRLRGGSSRDESLRLTPTLEDPARFSQNGSRDLWFDAQLKWELDQTVFSRDEISIERLRRAREQDRRDLTAQVLRALKRWQKAQIGLQEPLILPEVKQRTQLRALTAAALLDVLTNGWFSRHLPPFH